MVTRVEISAPDLVDLAVAIKYEEDGAVMRRDLLRGLRAAVRPAVGEAKASIMSMESKGLKSKGGSLRRAIARQITTETSLTTRKAKVKVKVRKRNFPRGFNNAPKATQLAGGWRHPSIHRGENQEQKWVHQVGKPGWFDNPLHSRREQYRVAVHEAMQRTADRIARKV